PSAHPASGAGGAGRIAGLPLCTERANPRPSLPSTQGKAKTGPLHQILDQEQVPFARLSRRVPIVGQIVRAVRHTRGNGGVRASGAAGRVLLEIVSRNRSRSSRPPPTQPSSERTQRGVKTAMLAWPAPQPAAT